AGSPARRLRIRSTSASLDSVLLWVAWACRHGPAPGGGIPHAAAGRSEDRVQERARRLEGVGERRPAQLVFARDDCVGGYPGLGRRRETLRHVVGAAERE